MSLAELEARIRALEDWQQAIARTCIATSTPQAPKPIASAPSTPNDKIENTINTVKKIGESQTAFGETKPTPAPINPVWEQMPPPVSKPENGPWERSRDLNNPALQEIINALSTHSGFYQDDLYKYWLMTDKQDNTKIVGVGRRSKA